MNDLPENAVETYPLRAEQSLASAAELGDYQEIFPISARKGWSLGELKAAIVARMAEGPQYFPEGAVSDQPERVAIDVEDFRFIPQDGNSVGLHTAQESDQQVVPS